MNLPAGQYDTNAHILREVGAMPSTIHNVIQTFQVPRARERALSGTAERPEKHWAQFREITTKLADAEKRFLPERKRAPLTKGNVQLH